MPGRCFRSDSLAAARMHGLFYDSDEDLVKAQVSSGIPDLVDPIDFDRARRLSVESYPPTRCYL